MFNGKNILLGVTGGIAAYKSTYLLSLLKKAGANVDVVMTEAATKFITPLTFETLSGNAVAIDLFSREKPWEVEHIALAQKADYAIIAPATANTVAKIACGIADNMLTTTLLACSCPVAVVPAMNTGMYDNIATRVNLQILTDRGFLVMPPAEGQLACGQSGKGRMPEPEDILSFLESAWRENHDLAGKTVLITAGPTREALDPVRYLTNRSSGKMGYALAQSAVKRGARVLLVSGPVAIAPPDGVEIYGVENAGQMHERVMELKEQADVIIMSAAVADYAPEQCAEHKMKKQEDLTLALKKTKDILADVGKEKSCFLAGFAAETRDLELYARKKLEKKNLDMIIANDVSGSETGFDSEYNAVSIFRRDGSAVFLPKDTKLRIADAIWTEIIKDIQ